MLVTVRVTKPGGALLLRRHLPENSLIRLSERQAELAVQNGWGEVVDAASPPPAPSSSDEEEKPKRKRRVRRRSTEG